MPPRKRASSSGDAGRSGRGDGGRGGENPPRPGRNPDADPVRLHREYVQRRLGGGALPTPERYENALDQWHRLPGAVARPSAELHPGAPDEEFTAAEERSDRESYDGPLPATDPGDNRPYEGGSR